MPEFANQQVTVTALGLAMRGSEAVYVSMVGPKGSLKSLWAGLVMNAGARTYAPGWRWQNFKLAGGARQFWAALPRSHAHQLVVRVMDPALLVLCDPHAARLYESNAATRAQRRALLAARIPEAQTGLLAWLENYEFDYQGAPARLPVLPHWAAPLWEYATTHHLPGVGYGIAGLESWGDCLGAFQINPQYPWANAVQELIQAGQLVW